MRLIRAILNFFERKLESKDRSETISTNEAVIRLWKRVEELEKRIKKE